MYAARETHRQLFFYVFLSFADSCSLLVKSLSRSTDCSRVFVDCIHVVFCRPLGLVTSFNACLSGFPSGNLKICPANLSLFIYFIGP